VKKIFCVLAFAGVCGIVAAQSKAIMVKSLDGVSIASVESETSGGNISVVGTSSGFRAELYAWPSNQKHKNITEQEIKEKISNEYDVKLETEGNRLFAIARPKKKIRNWKNGLNISFKIYVPRKTSSNLGTSGGNIELQGLEGAHDFATSGGNLVIEDVAGKIDGTTSGGNISVQHARDEIELTTSGGNIEAKDCSGKIKLSTSGGNVHMENLKGNINAGTSGGNVSGELIEGELKAATSGGNVGLSGLSCSVDAATTGGEIVVSVAKLLQHIRISNSGGNVKLTLPKGAGADLKIKGDKISTGQLENFNGKLEKETVEGKLNGGGPAVTVKADGGNVSLELE